MATSRMPPSERRGHGLVMSKHAKAVEIATKALEKVTSLPDGKGGKKIPVAEVLTNGVSANTEPKMRAIPKPANLFPA